MSSKRESPEGRIEKMSIPELILLAIFSIKNNKKESTFEDLLQECFNLSPKKLCFAKHKDWPDARKIDRPLRSLRQKGLIKQAPDTSFSLTRKGRKTAEELVKFLRQKKLFKD